MTDHESGEDLTRRCFMQSAASALGLLTGAALLPPAAAAQGTIAAAPTARPAPLTPSAAPGAWVNVLDYGAQGDGVTDDTLASRAAVTAAGPGGTILFPGGKTYLLSGSIDLLAGQTMTGYAAQLLRCNALATTTTTPIAAGQGLTMITVADAGSFRVGMDVTIYTGTQADGTFDTTNHRIMTITGNQMQLATPFLVAFPAGGTVITSFPLINAASGNPPDVRIFGIECHGNQANNAALQKWEIHQEIDLSSDRGVVRDCYIHDARAEGIIPFGNNVLIEHNYLLNCQGNGIHCSANVHVVVRDNYVKNCNLGGVNIGHADGCIIFSNGVQDAVITNNYMENGISGMGSIDSDDNSSVVVTGNVIRNCTSYALDMVVPGTSAGRVVFAGNLIYNSGILSLNNTWPLGGIQDVGPYRTLIKDNYIENTQVRLIRCWDVQFSGNVVFWNADTSTVVLDVVSSVNVAITTNTFRGGGYAVVVETTGGDPTAHILLLGNQFKNQQTSAIWFAGLQASPLPANLRVADNTITAPAGAAPGYTGIHAGNAVTVDGNTLALAVNSLSACGIVAASGGVGVPGAIITNNVVRVAGSTLSILFPLGALNNYATNNFCTVGPANLGGLGNILVGNYLVF